VEVELSVALVTASNRIETFGRSNPGVGVAAEVRYNFAQAPVDLGLNFSLATFSRSHSTREGVEKYNFDSQSLLLTADYNFFQGRMASLFVGCGAGISWCGRLVDNSRHGVAPCVVPRV
jgi:opacity protein-like surface antigen